MNPDILDILIQVVWVLNYRNRQFPIVHRYPQGSLLLEVGATVVD